MLTSLMDSPLTLPTLLLLLLAAAALGLLTALEGEVSWHLSIPHPIFPEFRRALVLPSPFPESMPRR